jgi:hypothetical protein
MSAAIGQSERKFERQSPQLSVRDLVLLRISTGSATLADLQRDVAPLLAPRIPGAEFRRSAELAISTLTGTQLVTEAKGRLTASGKGLQVAEALLAPSKTPCTTWRDVRTALVMRAVQAGDTPAIRKALQRAEGLAALVLQHHFGKSTSRVQSPADLRSDLAIIALEQAFGNKIKTGFKKGAGLPAKPGRVLAGQLFKQPREIASDGKLILHLACEVAGSRDHSLDALELAVLRGLAIPKETDEAPSPPTQRAPRSEPAQRTLPLPAPAPKPANDRLPISEIAPPRLRAPSPPDMAEVCRAVIDAARPVSEGWPGNRKAFISLVWKAIRNTRPDWGLSEIAFKGMLAEAHRSGRIELATADLKDGRDLQSLEDSKILYKNTVWHFVRVQD